MNKTVDEEEEREEERGRGECDGGSRERDIKKETDVDGDSESGAQQRCGCCHGNKQTTPTFPLSSTIFLMRTRKSCDTSVR